MKFEKPENYWVFSEALTANKDDLYNLSIRKKAASICQKLLSDFENLNICYEKIKEQDEAVKNFLIDNSQIELICKKILQLVSLKEKISHSKDTVNEDNLNLYIIRLLSEIAENIIALLSIITIRRVERELLYASELILKQLVHMLPYKTENL